MLKFITFILLLLPFCTVSQSITGKIYDDDTTVKGATLFNLTKNILTYSDENGNFTIEASVDDSIVFHTLFHLQKTIIVTQKDFNQSMIVALKKSINELDEVLLKNDPKAKPSDPVKVNESLKNQISEDIKRNPHLYQKTVGNGNILNIIGLVVKLFKSKKPKEDQKKSVSYAELEHLFVTDSYFTATFLKKELKISDDFKYLFFEFCEVQDIDSKLLLVDNRFFLLDTLLKHSSDFLDFIQAAKKIEFKN